MSQLTIAVSQQLIKKTLEGFINSFIFQKSWHGTSGNFGYSFEMAISLKGGEIKLDDDNTLIIKELDIKWNKFESNLTFNIPELDLPVVGKVFSNNPDFSMQLDLSSIITSEFSGAAGLLIKKSINPNRLAGWSDWEAEERGNPNKWLVFLDPNFVDIDILDMPDIATDFNDKLQIMIKSHLETMGIVEPVLSMTMLILSPQFLLDKLDVLDDMEESIKHWIGDLQIMREIKNELIEYFKEKVSIYQIPDPYRILPAVEKKDGVEPLVAVKLPIKELDFHINSREIVMEASVGE